MHYLSSEGVKLLFPRANRLTGTLPIRGLGAVQKISPACTKPFRRRQVQQGREWLDSSLRVARLFSGQSALPVREHGKMATCLREAAPAKAGNAALLIPS